MKHHMLFTALVAFAAAFDAPAATRHGVVTEMTPIENRGSDENPEVGKRRGIGRTLGVLAANGIALVGAKTGRSSDAAPVAMAAAPIVGEKVGERVGGPGPAAQYMVKVRLDSGKVLSLNKKRAEIEGIEVGERVRVEGSGGEARIFEQ